MTRKSEQSVLAELNGQKRKAMAKQSQTAGVGFAPKDSATASTLRITDSVSATQAAPEPAEPIIDAPADEPTPEAPAETQAADPAPALTVEALQQALASVMAPLQSQLSEVEQRNQALQAQLAESQAAAAEAAKAANILEGLSKLTGQSQFPNVNTALSPNRDRLSGRMAEFVSIQKNSGPSGMVGYRQSERFATSVPIYDSQVVDTWMQCQILGADGKLDMTKQIAVLSELEQYGKQHGLFRGKTITQTATTGADIPGGFLDMLSSYMRVTSNSNYVWHQFPVTIHEFQRGEGEAIKVPRALYNISITSSEDRLLSSSDTYSAITNENQNVGTTTGSFILKEYGLGKSGAPPIAISTFVNAFSMIPLMGILENTLMRDYYAWEDLAIRESLSIAATVYYNNADKLTTAAANIVSGGQMTRKFMGELYVQARTSNMVPFDVVNNAYALVMPTQALNQFKNSLEEKFAPATPEQAKALTEMLRATNYTGGMDLRVVNYIGLYEGLHLFEGNSFSSGASGTDGVLTETTTAASQTNAVFRTSYLLGGGALGRGIGGPGFQILFDEKTDFGRISRAIWHSYEAHGALDVDSSVSGQETRVYKVRTSDEPLTAS